MTTTGFSQRSVAALAALVHEGRPDWNEAGIAAEMRKHAHLPLLGVAMAMLRAATDPANDTPAVLSLPDARAWSDIRGWRCDEHPQERRCRTNGECASCYADRNSGDYEPRPPRDPAADPHPLETALAKLEAS